MPFRQTHHTDGDWQYDYLVQRFQNHLRDNQRWHLRQRDDPKKSERKEYNGIGRLTEHGADNSAGREIAARLAHFHPAHDIRIDERPYEESKKRGRRYAWSETENSVKTRVAAPIRSAGNGIGDSSEHHE